MRDIKFRAYIKDTNKRVPSEINKIVEVKSLHLGSRKAIIGYSKSSSNYGNYSISFDDIELMQYTGLHDKNGKEIYEGDIVEEVYFNPKFDEQERRYGKYIVKYEEDRCGYVPFACGDGCGCCEDEVINVNNAEVIGNVWDNPDLLEKGAEE